MSLLSDGRRWLSRLLIAQLERDHVVLNCHALNYAEDNLYTSNNADFLKDERFLDAYRAGVDVGPDLNIRWRTYVVCWATRHASQLPGDFVECGVNTGVFAKASIRYTGFENLEKTYYLLDTFAGLDPAYSTREEMRYSDEARYAENGSLFERASEAFSLHPNVKIIRGSVPETLPLVKADQVAYLSLDMNCVEPEIEALRHFWDLMVTGGIVLLDDYGSPWQTDQKTAHDTFFRGKGLEVLALPTRQGLVVKP